jgi:hypothetical protein
MKYGAVRLTVYWTKKFKLTVLLTFILLLCVICAGVQQGLHAPIVSAQQEEQRIAQIRYNITTAGIFLNNWPIFVSSFIPVIGWIRGITDWWSSGVSIGKQFEVANITTFFYVLICNPFVYTEALCLSLFIGESVYLVILAMQNLSSAKERLRKYTWITFLAASTLTFISAWAEYLLIQGQSAGWLVLLAIFFVVVFIIAESTRRRA